MATRQTFYLGVAADNTPDTLPSGAIATWTIAGSLVGSSAVPMGGTAASSQTTRTGPTPSSRTATDTGLYVQYYSDPLAAQTISSGDWTVAWAQQLPGAGSGRSWGPRAALYVRKSDGTARGTIFGPTNIGSQLRTTTAERTAYSLVTGGSVTCSDGDYLVLEVGTNYNGTGNYGSTADKAYDKGATTISSDNQSTSDARSRLVAPAALTLYVPAKNISASAYDASGAIGSTTINQDIQGSGIATTAAIGSATVVPPIAPQDIQATGLATGAMIGSATVAPQPVDIQASGLASTAAVGTPSLTQDIRAVSLDSDATVAQPSLTQDISPTGVATAAGIGQPEITAASLPQDITLGAGADWAGVGTPGIEQVVSLSGQDWSGLGIPAVQHEAPAEIVMSGIPTSSGIGTPSVTQDIQAAEVGSDFLVGSLVVTTYNEIQAAGLPTQAALGTPTSVLPEQTITLGGTDWGAVGAPLVANEQDIALNAGAAWGAVGTPLVAPDQDITLEVGSNWSALGEPSIERDVVRLYGEAWGLFDGTGVSVVPGPVDIACTGNDFSGSVGTPGEVSPGPVNISLTGVDFSGMNLPQGPFGWVTICAAAYGEPASEFLKRLRLGLGVGL